MKILIVGQIGNPQYENKYLGGVERAERMQAEALSTSHDVTFLITKDSDKFSDYPFRVIHHAENSILNNPKPRKSVYDFLAYHIKKEIENNYYDFVIINSVKSSMIKRLSTINHEKIFFILHVFPSNMGMIGFSIFESLMECKNNGHRVFTVSEFAIKEINEYGLKTKYLIENGFSGELVEKIPFPVCYSRERFTICESKNYGISVGRISPEKMLKFSASLFSEADFPSKIYTNYNPAYEEYFSSVKELSIGKNQLIIDKPYEEIMKSISEASFCLSSWPKETFGLVNFEAFERGVPVILNSKKNGHASDTFLKNTDYHFPLLTYKKSRKEIKEQFLSFIEKINLMTLKERKELANFCFENYNIHRFVGDIEKIYNMYEKNTHKQKELLFQPLF